MSIKDRLTKKTEGLFVPHKSDSTVANAGAAPLRTSPGQMLMVNSLMKESNEKVAALENRLKQFEGVIPVRLLDADKVVASKWANRIADSFATPDFLFLKEEIAHAGGNVQPIKVRPLPSDPSLYEIVFGHRRHRACLELGFPVLAVVDKISDQDLFKEMDRENRARLDLSAWEQGCMYQRALNDRLFSSINELAKELGVDKGNVSKALRLAALPDYVVRAFQSPLDLQFRWAKILDDALQADSVGVLARANELALNRSGIKSAKDVLDKLIGKYSVPEVEENIFVQGQAIAKITTSGQRTAVHFSSGIIDEAKKAKLRDFISSLAT